MPDGPDAGRLSKRHAETLVVAIDGDALQDRLADALRVVLRVDAYEGDWAALVRLAGLADNWEPERRRLLVEAHPGAMAELAAELNERRTLG